MPSKHARSPKPIAEVRKPRAPTRQEDQFVARGPETLVKSPGRYSREGDAPKVKLYIYADREVAKKLKKFCFDREIPMTEFMDKLVRRAINEGLENWDKL